MPPSAPRNDQKGPPSGREPSADAIPPKTSCDVLGRHEDSSHRPLHARFANELPRC